jgi:hypothetical protein
MNKLRNTSILKKEINIYLTLSEEDQLFTSAERIAKMV